MLTDLKVSIVRSGKTQRQLSRETQIPEVRLSAIVRGVIIPRAGECEVLESALGITPGAIAAEVAGEATAYRSAPGSSSEVLLPANDGELAREDLL